MLCGDLNGWETQKRGDKCTQTAGALCWRRDEHSIVKQLYSDKNLKNNKIHGCILKETALYSHNFLPPVIQAVFRFFFFFFFLTIISNVSGLGFL